MSAYLSSPAPANGPPRLFCFPHAGGGPSAYARWPALLGRSAQVMAVRLPGHEGRFDEPRPTSLTDLVTDLLTDLAPHLHPPYILYGHSMGALIAYALSVGLATAPASTAPVAAPAALIVAACRAPHLPVPLAPDDDCQLVAALQALGGFPPQLAGRPEWLSVLLPLVRDDLRLSRCPLPPAAPLPCGVTALAVEDDPIAPLSDVRQWRAYTRGRFTVRTVGGGHFCHRDAAPAVTAVVAGAIAGVLRSTHPG